MLKKEIVLAVCAAMGVVASMPTYAADDAEVQALRAELAAQRQLLDQVLAAQKNNAPQSPTDAAGLQRAAGQKGAIDAPQAVPANPAAPVFRFYGIADVAAVVQNTGYGPHFRLDGGGGFASSRLGVQATSTVGGVKVTALAEAGVQYDNGGVGGTTSAPGANNTTLSSSGQTTAAAQIFSRQAFVGVDAGFGQVSIGRQYTGSYAGAAGFGDAQGNGFYGNSGLVTPLIGNMPTRVNNSLAWNTMSVGPVRGIFTYFVGNENNTSGASATPTTDQRAGRGVDLALVYSYPKGVSLVSVWDDKKTTWDAAHGETGLATGKGFQYAGNYDFGIFKLFGNIAHGTISGGNYQNVTKTLSGGTAYGVSLLVPVGIGYVVPGVTHINDTSLANRDGTLFGLSYYYEYTKNATFYTSAGKFHNNGNASYALQDGGNVVGNVSKVGFSPSGLEAGVDFKF